MIKKIDVSKIVAGNGMDMYPSGTDIYNKNYTTQSLKILAEKMNEVIEDNKELNRFLTGQICELNDEKHKLEEKIARLKLGDAYDYLKEKTEGGNYHQVGETIECSACQPGKVFQSCEKTEKDYGIKCDCICHKKINQLKK